MILEEEQLSAAAVPMLAISRLSDFVERKRVQRLAINGKIFQNGKGFQGKEILPWPIIKKQKRIQLKRKNVIQ